MIKTWKILKRGEKDMEDKETIISNRTFKRKGGKRMFKVRMAKNLPHLMKMTNPKIQQAE